MSIECCLRMKDVSRSFERWGQRVIALDHVDLEIPIGQWLMVVGSNGAGKSTLLNLISARLSGYSGSIEVFGEPIQRLSRRRLSELVFHVTQDPLNGTAPALTVFENLFISDLDSYPIRRRRRELEAKYRALTDVFSIADRLHQQAAVLSGGERQLLALLIAKLRPCPVLLLDEPLGALDPKRAQECLTILSDLHREGRTLIQVTHDVELAARQGDRTVGLHCGHVIYDSNGAMRDEQAIIEATFFTLRPTKP